MSQEATDAVAGIKRRFAAGFLSERVFHNTIIEEGERPGSSTLGVNIDQAIIIVVHREEPVRWTILCLSLIVVFKGKVQRVFDFVNRWWRKSE